jgi:hypothetical protein
VSLFHANTSEKKTVTNTDNSTKAIMLIAKMISIANLVDLINVLLHFSHSVTLWISFSTLFLLSTTFIDNLHTKYGIVENKNPQGVGLVDKYEKSIALLVFICYDSCVLVRG